MRRSAGAFAASEGAYARGWGKGTRGAVGIWHTRRAARGSIGSNMKPVTLLVIALALAASPRALATEAKPLQLKLPKAALATAPLSHGNAPFVVMPVAEPEVDLLPRRDARQDQSRSSCNSNSALCYDAGSGRIVYKPSRNFMPDLPGFTPENISLRRDRIVFRYSF
jgi:hypothetical protein